MMISSAIISNVNDSTNTSDDIEMNYAYLEENEKTRQGLESDEICELKEENVKGREYEPCVTKHMILTIRAEKLISLFTLI